VRSHARDRDAPAATSPRTPAVALGSDEHPAHTADQLTLTGIEPARNTRYHSCMENGEHPLHGDVNWLLNRAWLGFGQRKAAALETVGVNIKEHFVLVALLTTPMTQLELSALVKIDKSVITATLDALEAKGLVVRVADVRDRRVRRPTLTPRGRKACLRATAATERVEQDLLDLLDPTQRDGFLEALRYYAFEEFAETPEFTRRMRK
jgi:DNA-binding MarR family transcriptional regulator